MPFKSWSLVSLGCFVLVSGWCWSDGASCNGSGVCSWLPLRNWHTENSLLIWQRVQARISGDPKRNHRNPWSWSPTRDPWGSGSSWLLLVPPGCSWLLLASLYSSWVPIGPTGSSWLLLAPPGCSWLLLTPPGSSWLLQFGAPAGPLLH